MGFFQNLLSDPIGTIADTAGKFVSEPSWMTGAAILGSSLLGSNASNQAANTQANAANRAADLQYKQYQENVARQKPFYDVGVNALPELVQASKYTPFTMDKFQQDPGYAFRLKEGQQALDRSAAARGGLISGGALKAATRYGQDMGSQEYTNAFNRYQAERQARLGPLQSLTGMGQTTAQQIGGAGQTMASNVGEAYQGAANARASGYLGGANAVAGGVGQYINYNQGNNLVAALQRNNSVYNAPAGYGTPVLGDFSTLQG
jgi:hypothetical protein